MSFGYCLDKEKRVFLEVLFYNQQKDLWFFYKTVLGISKIPLHLQGRRILKKTRVRAQVNVQVYQLRH